MTDVATTKNCGNCERELPLGLFKKDRRYKDDLSPQCKECWANLGGVKVADGAGNGTDPGDSEASSAELEGPIVETDPANRITDVNSAEMQTDPVAPPDVNPSFTHRIDPFNRTKDKVAIIGFTQHRDLALELDRSEFEIWGLNELYRFMPADIFDRWFEIHPREDLEINDEGKQHIADMGKLEMPVYMHQPWSDVAPSVRFPKGEIERTLDDDYFTSSPAWMIGMAIAMGFKEIHVYGVDMAQDTEYCTAPETMVLKADLTWVCADELRMGDEVIAYDEEPGIGTQSLAELARRDAESGGGTAVESKAVRAVSRQWRVATVEKANTITRPSYKIHLADGTKITSSAEHRWLTRSENAHRWRATEDLVTSAHRNDKPTKLVRVVDRWEEDQTREAGFLAAAFDGEGCLRQAPHSHCNGHSLQLGYSQLPNAMAEEVRRCLDVFGFKWSEAVSNETGVINFNILGGRSEIMRFLGQIRPPRLLSKFDPNVLGSMQRKATVAVDGLEFIGDQEVVALKTSEGTFIAEGFASHNSEQRSCCEYWLGYAKGRGIKVYTPDVSDLLSAIGQYGFGTEGGLFFTKLEERTAWLHEQDNQRLAALRQLQAEYDQKNTALKADFDEKFGLLSAERNQIVGGIQDCDYWKRSWAVKSAAPAAGAVPDRSEDPRTGIDSAEQDHE